MKIALRCGLGRKPYAIGLYNVKEDSREYWHEFRHASQFESPRLSWFEDNGIYLELLGLTMFLTSLSSIAVWFLIVPALVRLYCEVDAELFALHKVGRI